LLAQACVSRHGRQFLSFLIVRDPVVAPAWARVHGIEAASIASLADNEQVRAEVQRNVDEANQQFSRTEGIKRFTILPDEWMPDSEELTPTMKLKRRGIHEKYAAEIEGMYADT